MPSAITVKGQVTIPKRVRAALALESGDLVDFVANAAGEVVVRKASTVKTAATDRFSAARGKAQVPWRTADLMALLRND